MLDIGMIPMEEKKIKVNNREYSISLNDQTQLNAMKLKRLYQQSIMIWTVLTK